MNNWLVDTHCHLDLFNDIVNNFRQEDALPIKTITVTNAPSFFEHNCKLFKDASNIRVALGLHPELVENFGNELELFESLLTQTRYIGEIGLDGSKPHISTYPKQLIIFRKIVSSISKHGNKIVTVHSRGAAKDTIEILSTIPRDKKCKVILHWYTGEVEHIKAAISAGFYFSVNHKMISTKNGQGIIAAIPLNRILSETDAPFTLVKNADRVRAITSTIKELASLYKTTSDDMQKTIFQNFREILSDY